MGDKATGDAIFIVQVAFCDADEIIFECIPSFGDRTLKGFFLRFIHDWLPSERSIGGVALESQLICVNE